MNQNKNNLWPLYTNSTAFDVQRQNGAVSIFNFQQEQQSLIEQNKVNRKNSFCTFINSRNRYLTGLNKLGDNWISGNSKQPTLQSTELAKSLLSNIGIWYETKGFNTFIYPKILMSPTPSGGIAMEIELFSKLRAYITILDDKINLEIERDGLFVEQEADKNNMSEILLTLYNTHERRYYSERGLPV